MEWDPSPSTPSIGRRLSGDAVAEIDCVAIIVAEDDEMRMDVEWRERAKVARFWFVYLSLSFGALCTR